MTRKVIYIQYANPAAYPPLEHSSKILADRGWSVVLLGIDSRAEDILCFSEHPNRRVKRLSYRKPGLIQKFHYIWYCLWAIGWGIFWRPSWIYASDLFSCPPALFLSLFGYKIIYHEHDSPFSRNKNSSFFIRFLLRMRKALSKKSRLSILPNENRGKHFASEMGGSNNVFCVWNCPRLEEASLPDILEKQNGLSLLYHGSIVPQRLPLAVLHALAVLPSSVTLTVVGYETIGHRGYVQQLQATALKLGIKDRMSYLGALPRYELLAQAKRHHIGLCFMPKDTKDINMRYMTGASNKPFDYMACGLALLVSDLPDWKKMYVEPGYGLTCNPEDPKSIANAIQWFLDHPEDMRKMGEAGRKRIINEWNYEMQFESVRKLLVCETP